MKMIIAIIGSEDADDLVYELNQHSFFVTKLSTMGGFLKKKSTTLMLCVEDERGRHLHHQKNVRCPRAACIHAADHGRKLLPDCQYDRSDEHESRRSNRICNKCRRISEILIF